MARDDPINNVADTTAEATDRATNEISYVSKSVNKLISQSVLAGTLVGAHLGDLSKIIFQGAFGTVGGTLTGLFVSVILYIYWRRIKNLDEVIIKEIRELDDEEAEGLTESEKRTP